MLLFPNATVHVAALTVSKNKEGMKIKTFDFENPLETFAADVQPYKLTSYQIKVYGINAKTANTTKCFTDIKNGIYMTPGNRAKVVYNDGAEEVYDIHPVNKWRFHKEFLLIPVENENGQNHKS